MFTKGDMSALRVRKDIEELQGSQRFSTRWALRAVLARSPSHDVMMMHAKQYGVVGCREVGCAWAGAELVTQVGLPFFRAGPRQASTVIDFPAGEHNVSKIRVSIRMTGGMYERGSFTFLVDIPPAYPFSAPSVTALTRVFHPNIDLATGKVLLPILDKDWRPVLSINAVVFGLQVR